MLSDNRPSTSGKHWFITLQEQVGPIKVTNHIVLNITLVREILPELIDQLIKLLSSEEIEQQEVRWQRSKGTFS